MNSLVHRVNSEIRRCHSRRSWVTKLSVIALAMLTVIAKANDDYAAGIGGSRAAGMANVGVALPYIIGAQGKFNPAFYGMASRKFRLNSPTIGVKMRDITYSQLRKVLGNIRDGGLNDSGAKLLAELLQREQIEADVLADFGIGGGNFDFSLDTQVGASALPNRAARTFATNFGEALDLITSPEAQNLANDILNIRNDNIQQELDAIINNPQYQALYQLLPELLAKLAEPFVTSDGRSFRNAAGADTYGYGYYSANLSYGTRIKSQSETDVAVGVRAKLVNAYYTHLIVDTSDTSIVREAPEMAGKKVLERRGFGMDIGVVATFGRERNQHVGLVIENMIRPNVGIQGTAPLDSNPVFDLNGNLQSGSQVQIQPFRTLVSLGYGIKHGRWIAGADWFDIGNATKQGELRLGAEYMFHPAFGIRAGYGSKTRITVGVSLLGIAFTIGSNLPATVSAAFKF